MSNFLQLAIAIKMLLVKKPVAITDNVSKYLNLKKSESLG